MEKSQSLNADEINKFLISQPKLGKLLWDEMVYLRERELPRQKADKQQQTDRPVAVLIKPDRLRTGPGTELVIIFRSLACSWAHSKSGGCTMCGYWNDRAPDITPENLWGQFEYALEKNIALLTAPTAQIVVKLFTSGSFCDPKEVPIDLQLKILQKLASFPTIKEIVAESRPEFLTADLLTQYKTALPTQYFEAGVGLETADDFIRNSIINKGFDFTDFRNAMERLHAQEFGMKAYLLLKPPFLSEYAALDDLIKSLKVCIAAGVDTISINPTVIQQNTLCAELDKDRAYRPPWLFSLLFALKRAVTAQDLKKTRVLCDPMALGKDRGVHNCDPAHESNDICIKQLQKFVETQDIGTISGLEVSPCWKEYLQELFLGYK